MKRTDTPVVFAWGDRVEETNSTNQLDREMFRHSTNTASFFSVLIVALIFSLSLAGAAAAQTNTRGQARSLATPRASDEQLVETERATGRDLIEHVTVNGVDAYADEMGGDRLFLECRKQAVSSDVQNTVIDSLLARSCRYGEEPPTLRML
jgi:hypothetical protein